MQCSTVDQESMGASVLVTAVIFFELFFVDSLSICGGNFGLSFYLSVAISVIFFTEICLRYYNWLDSVKFLQAEDMSTKKATSENAKNHNNDVGMRSFFRKNVMCLC
jgi:hypothetical protein